MEINTNEINEISFSSFLAGCLLVKNSISNSELCNISSDFTIKYDVYFGDDSNDYNYEHIKWLFSEGPGFVLNEKYNDIIELENGRKMTVYDYLYNYTHVFVKSYFDLPDHYDPDYKWEMDVSSKKRRS